MEECRRCGRRISSPQDHGMDCPDHRFSFEAANISSLGAKRFHKASLPNETPATDAIEAALEAMKEEPADHIIVILSKDHGDGSTNTRFFNSGTLNSLAQYGMLQSTLHMMLKGGNP